jgi:hypothetical protein
MRLNQFSPVKVTLLTILGLTALNALPHQAQAQETENVRPKCNQRSNGNWICVFGDTKEIDGSPYKSYEGPISNGIPNGYGVLVYDNDDRYEGDVRRGVPNGRGMFVFADNSRYEGQVSRGKPNGQGAFTFSNGDKYSGGMLAGQPHGEGTFRFALGDSYSGQFYLGQAKGSGVFKSAQGIRCEGRFFSSNLSGEGSCSYPRGFGVASYVGEFRKGQPEGRGRIVYLNGNSFAGEFRNGRPFNPRTMSAGQ